MKYLIIEADDFGLTPGINRAIRETIAAGIVSSTSVCMNGPCCGEAKDLQTKNSKISIGIHLNISIGKPLSYPGQIRTLVNPDTQQFWNEKVLIHKIIKGRIQLSEVEKELSAQVEKALELGLTISHLNSHQNLHRFPSLLPVFLKVGIEHKITTIRSLNVYHVRAIKHTKLLISFAETIRNTIIHLYQVASVIYARRRGFHMADRLISFDLLNDGKYSVVNWMKTFKYLPEGINEIYVHPAYPDKDLQNYSDYLQERDMERRVLEALHDEDLLTKFGINLISYNDMNQMMKKKR